MITLVSVHKLSFAPFSAEAMKLGSTEPWTPDAEWSEWRNRPKEIPLVGFLFCPTGLEQVRSFQVARVTKEVHSKPISIISISNAHGAESVEHGFKTK